MGTIFRCNIHKWSIKTPMRSQSLNDLVVKWLERKNPITVTRITLLLLGVTKVDWFLKHLRAICWLM